MVVLREICLLFIVMERKIFAIVGEKEAVPLIQRKRST